MDVTVLHLFLTFVVISSIGLQDTHAEHVLQTTECPHGWVSLHRGCYKFFGKKRSERRSRDDAQKDCEAKGGELNIIQSQNEKSDVEKYLQSHYRVKTLWVNLSKMDNGEWKWGDKSSVDETLLSWSNERIKDSPRGPCGALASGRKGLSLTNDKCRYKKAYICEYHDINPRASTLSVLEERTSGKSVEEQSTLPSTKLSTKEIPKVFVPTPTTPRTTPIKSTTVKDSATVNVKTERNNPTPFTFPSKTRTKKPATQTTVTEKLKITSPKAVFTNTAKNSKEETSSQTTVSSTKLTSSSSHSSIQKVSTRVTRSTTGVSLSPSTTSTSDDLETEHETDVSTELNTAPTHRFTKLKPFPGFSKGRPTRLTSIFHPSTTTSATDHVDEADVDDDADDEDDGGVGVEEISKTTGDEKPGHQNPFNRKNNYRSTSPHPRDLWTTTPKIKMFVEKSFGYWVEAMEEYEGCYIPGMRGAVRQMVMTARNMYKDGADYCPPVTASRLTFPRTEAGETAVVPCRRGTGHATLHCGDDTVCWEDQPNLSGCASPKFKALLEKIKEKQIKEIMVSSEPEEETEVAEQSVNMTSELVAMTEDDDISMEDILATSEVLTAFSHTTEDREVKVRDKKVVKRIVGNVIKAGNNLLSKKKKKLWKKMQRGDKVRSASSLMVAMETATLSVADNIDEPAVITQVEENVEIQIQVVDVEKLEKEDKAEIVYDSEKSENTFSIPLENLKSTSEDKLDKVVFITHYSMAEFLDGDDDDEDGDDDTDTTDQDESVDDKNTFSGGKDEGVVKEKTDLPQEEEEDEDPAPQIASYILSATITSGEGGHKKKLRKPVRFTMKHTKEVRKEHTRLCSFWDVSQGGSQGFWSQVGCHVKKSNLSHTSCECDHMTSFAILIDVHRFETPEVHQVVLRLITIIGCVISCLCLVISWLTFQFCTALQGERNSIHKNLTACLFVSELLFVAGVTHTEPKEACSVVAVLLHFFFLSAFTWMFLEGLHIIFMLVQVFDASRSRLPYYYLAGYGLPVIVVVISGIVYFPGYGTDEFCWLTTDRHFIWAFAGPVALILLVNAVFLTYAMTTVCRHSDYVFNAKDRGAGSPIRSWIQGALALEVLLGLTWTFGYFLLDANTLPLAYLFTVLNSLQGLFIFIFHCLLNKKAQKEYSRILRVPLGGMSSIFASTHSTTGKRTNASSKGQEMTHSTSNGRKTSLNYKPSNGSQHNNYFNDKYHNRDSEFLKNDENKILYNNNGELQSSKDVGFPNGNAIITMDDA